MCETEVLKCYEDTSKLCFINMEDQKFCIAVGVVFRIPGVLLLELLYMEAVSLRHVTFLKHNFDSSTLNMDIFLYLLAWCIILLPVRILRVIYFHLIAAVCTLVSHYVLHQWLLTQKLLVQDVFYMPPVYTSKSGNITWVGYTCKNATMDSCVSIFLLQFALVLLSCWMIRSKGSMLFIYLPPLLPWIAGSCVAADVAVMLQISYLLSGIFAVIYVVGSTSSVLSHIRMMWLKIKLLITLFGLHGIIAWCQDEYQIQKLLVSCWVLRYIVQLIANFYHNFSVTSLDQSFLQSVNLNVGELPSAVSLLLFLILTMVQCLTTTINLFGLACIVKDVVRLQYFLTR